MNSSGEVAFIEGRVYTSEKNGCLTNEQGIKDHHVDYAIDPFDTTWLEKHFTFYNDVTEPILQEIFETDGYKETDGKLSYELDFEFITQMAERMDANKGKYEPYNWQKPHDITGLYKALARHFFAVMKGEFEDDGREFGHLEALGLNAMMINYQVKNNK